MTNCVVGHGNIQTPHFKIRHFKETIDISITIDDYIDINILIIINILKIAIVIEITALGITLGITCIQYV